MRKITQKLVKEVKSSNNQNWHDSDWHDFMNQPEVLAVNYALEFVGNASDLKDVVEVAKEYMAAQK